MKTFLFVTTTILTIAAIIPVSVRAEDGKGGGGGGAYQLWEWWFRWQETTFNPDVPDAEKFDENVSDGTTNTLVDTVKSAINWILGLLAFIALVFLLYGGFKVLTAGTDEGALEDAWKIVKNAALGILLIAISWIVVTFIFYIAGILTEDTDTKNNAIGSEEMDGVKNAWW
jgi:hypothetical protein